MEHLSRNKTERAPTIEVANKTIWENKDVRAPFAIEPDAHSPFGVQLAVHESADATGFPGLLRALHGRTIDIGKVYFEDTSHRLYRDVDIKGTGLVETGILGGETEPKQWHATRTTDNDPSMDVRGLLDKKDALTDATTAELFTSLGIRTHRVLAIIELQELIQGDQRISIGELQATGKLHPDFTPVAEVRAFGVKTRPGDLFPLYRSRLVTGETFVSQLYQLPLDELVSPYVQSLARGAIEDVLSFLAQEQKRSWTKKEYIEWFIQETARNVGSMHNAGYVHKYLHSQNSTLDARLTDFDDVYRLSKIESNPNLSPQEIQEDQETLIYNDINFDITNRRTGILAWLEPYAIFLKKLYPDELKEFDPSRTNALFFEQYAAQLTDTKMRDIFDHCMSGNGTSLSRNSETGN